MRDAVPVPDQCCQMEGGGAIQGKEGIKFCSVAIVQKPEGPKKTILKSGYRHLATMSLIEGQPGVCGSPAPFKTDPKRTPSPREDEIVL